MFLNNLNHHIHRHFLKVKVLLRKYSTLCFCFDSRRSQIS